MAKITVNDLLEAGVHFGHQTKRWNPKMKPYIYGTRNGISIFDLTKTLRLLGDACNFLRDTVAAGGEIVFVGSKRQAQEILRETAEQTGQFFMCNRWLGGTLTNNKVILRRVAYMKGLQAKLAEGPGSSLTKKEIGAMRKELAKLDKTLGGIANLRGKPAALVVVDVVREAIAVKEASKVGIPVVGIVDSNGDPNLVAHVVPGNDDALRAIKVVIDAFAVAINDGRAMAGKEATPAPAAAAPAAVPSPEAPAAAAAPEAAPAPAAEARE